MLIAESERLILREITPDDADDLYELYTDPVNMRYMGIITGSRENELENLKKHIAGYYRKHGFGLWAVIDKQSGRLIGRCGFLLLEIDGVKQPELGYVIDRKYTGRGLATEAARAALRAGFEKFGFDRVIAVIDPRNEASVRVAEHAGLRFEKEMYLDGFGAGRIYSIDRKKNDATRPEG